MRISAAYNRLIGYVFALVMIAVFSAILFVAGPITDTTVVALLLLIPVGLATAAWGLGPGVTAAISAFLAFNFLFIKPYFTFTVHQPGDLVILVVFLIVAIVISQLVARAAAGVLAATAREREATQLYELSTALAGLRDAGQIEKTLGEQLFAAFPCEHLEITLTGQQTSPARLPAVTAPPERAPDLVVAMQAVRGAMGEIRLWAQHPPVSAAERRLVKTFSSQGALALERAALAQAEARASVLEESDRFKTSLLSSVSHELRSPLATIKAAASSLRSGEIGWDSAARPELLAAIDDETDHLNILVGNLLDMSRIESGALHPQRKWNVLLEIVQTVVDRTRHISEDHRLTLDIPEDLPLVPVDFVQMGQVFTNLISNSMKYAPPQTEVRVQARARGESTVQVEVSNQGPPIPAEHLKGIFDKFYRMRAVDRVTGTGLGLSICKGIVEAHGGRIWAENLPDGLAFRFTVPLQMELGVEPRPAQRNEIA